MKRIVSVTAVFLFILLATANSQPPWGDVYQLLENSDFEDGYTPGNWKLRIDAIITTVEPYSGIYHAAVYDSGSLGVIEQTINLEGCMPGDIWVRAPYKMAPSSFPWPDDAWGRDVSDGWIEKNGQLVAWLWHRYDYEWWRTEYGYHDVYYRVTGLFDICSGKECTLRFSAHNDDGPEHIDWVWDDVEVFCLAPNYKIYLVIIQRNG